MNNSALYRVAGVLSGITGLSLLIIFLITTLYLPDTISRFEIEPEDLYVSIDVILLTLPLSVVLIWMSILFFKTLIIKKWFYLVGSITILFYSAIMFLLGIFGLISQELGIAELVLFLPLVLILGIIFYAFMKQRGETKEEKR